MKNISVPDSIGGEYITLADDTEAIFIPTNETIRILYSFFFQNSELSYMPCCYVEFFKRAPSTTLFCPYTMIGKKV